MFEHENAIAQAVADRQLLPSAARNSQSLLGGATSDLYARVVDELIVSGAWSELNDRFYKTLAFGTGGLRGRTIGKVLTTAERGNAAADARPEFPCIGTNAMNFYNIGRATRGLVAYLHEYFRAEKLAGKPKIVIAHDTRFFSPEFTALTAKVAAENGCDACVFDGPRSTPELSFAVRHLRASAGIVITASHNPPHDNGYKVYFDDGAQVVEPHASGIIAKVNAITSETYEISASPGGVIRVGPELDNAYMARLESLVLDLELVRAVTDLRIVFTPIHGTGGVITEPMLQRLGFSFQVVPEQAQADGKFRTVTSPNPENAEALKLGVALADQIHADVVVATDPDCDRMGVAVRTASGEMKLLTGNQIGSVIAYYRAKTLFDRGVLTTENAARAVIIKTFVTTDLQKAIAEHYGIRCVETLTGFKYIGAKLGKYERALPENIRANYRDLSEEQTRTARLAQGSYYVFGGEESYGYSAHDFVRDKDGNAAAIMFCEVAAYAKSRGQTVDALLDEIFTTFGYFQEKNGSLTFEGAEGAEKIKRLLESYVAAPPAEMLGSRVAAVKNFERETFRDVEGDVIPKEKMLIFELEDRTRLAVRASGTEPKIKYYLFAQRRSDEAKFTAEQLAATKTEVGQHLERLWSWLQEDAHARAAR
ncbi:MAG: phospho-sugar mutase [Verrucomicrobiota bacterium]|nr:phospho-sugar mutase [Verrucomicrobiota bacterium]